MTETTGPRTLVVGIDACSRDVLSRLSPGVAPTITSLLEDGASGPLESQLPPWTPSAWPSMFTGVNPGKHGVYGFLRFEGYDWDVVNATDVREHSLWEICSQHGLTSVVVNVPVTHPPGGFDGALIPGYTAPEDPDCHPPGLLEEVREETGEYRLYGTQLSEGATREERIDGYEELVEMRGRALRYLIDREDPEFAFVQFQQSDTVFHEFPEGDAPDRVYAAIDDEIRTTLETCEPETVVLVSDHGIGPYAGHEVRPNVTLRDLGLLETATGIEKPSWSDISTRRLRKGRTEDPEEEDGRSPAEALLAAAASVGITSQRVGAVLERLGLADAVLRVVPPDLVSAAGEHVDFPVSTAYLRDRIEMGIRINLAGREPEGVVEPEAYDEVRDRVIDAFVDMETPDGRPAFDAVLPREEVFSGPYLDDAPDVVLVPAAFDQYLSASIRETPFGEPREPYNHKLHGIVGITGPGIEPRELSDAHLLDVAPTVLSLLGIPVSDRMDGTALPVVDSPPRATLPPYAGEPVSTENANVESRLASLGYLE